MTTDKYNMTQHNEGYDESLGYEICSTRWIDDGVYQEVLHNKSTDKYMWRYSSENVGEFGDLQEFPLMDEDGPISLEEFHKQKHC